MSFEHVVPVRWRDTDALGHVNHAVYLTYLETARDAFFTAAISGPMYVVVRVELDFRAEVRLEDAAVTVRIDVEKVGKTSLTTREAVVLPSGTVAAEARIVTVRWDRQGRVPVSFSEDEAAALMRWGG